MVVGGGGVGDVGCCRCWLLSLLVAVVVGVVVPIAVVVDGDVGVGDVVS